MSGLERGGRQPQAVLLGWRSQCLSASSTGLCVSGQAGLHGNVLQSCCLLAAFCWSRCEADGGETTQTNHPLLLGPAPPVQALLSSLLNTPPFFHHAHHSSKGQAMTRETVMSQTAHCWRLHWCFWLMATSLKGIGGKMFCWTFSPVSFCSCPDG